MKQNRRQFLTNTLVFGAWSLLPAKTIAGILQTARFQPFTSIISPIAEIPTLTGTSNVLGDTFDEAHAIFWNKEGFLAKKGGIPTAKENFDVVIAGAGIAGLTTAFKLPTDKKILILDGHPRLGGNAKAEKHLDTYMALGSAYTTIPEEGDTIDSFYEEIGIKEHFRKVSYEKSDLCFKDKIVSGFWEGVTDPKNAHEFIRVHKRLMEIYENEYPELPTIAGVQDEARKYFNQLDEMSFKEWAQAEFGNIHPHIEEFFHQYSWSSFCMGYGELSAAQALNFITSDLAGIQALPGGNAAIAQSLFEKLKKRSNVTFRTSSFTVDVREQGKGVQVTYHLENRILESITAKQCVIAFPKMVAKYVIDSMPQIQRDAMEKLSYRAYLVANVILKKKIKPHDYDLYALSGSVPEGEYKESMKRVYTDITFAHWANENEAQGAALTLYIPLPYAMAQQYLFNEALYEKYSSRIKARIEPFLQNIGLSLNDIEGIRLTRYGHALPTAFKGGVAKGLFDQAQKSIAGKIHFAGQDNWCNPSVEAAVDSGFLAAKWISSSKLL